MAKRKSHKMSEYFLVTESCQEQEIVEEAAFHLILLSKSLQQSHSYDKEDDSVDNGDRSSSRGSFGMSVKKKKNDHGKEGIVEHNNDQDANSITSSSSSSLSCETVQSGISIEKEEMEDNKRVYRRHRVHRLRSVVDIYHVTRPL
ncbi:hypothetical protein CTI12_AA147210 [Artemisia annua]|uniref:Uncharacterized protein n=1 Tax=Artemisia annua TaxID=35608 RepID=A0A2U1PI61_ARTAN|nr:hypothetical protein CTI12_AA147210 [Artemisia annua]